VCDCLCKKLLALLFSTGDILLSSDVMWTSDVLTSDVAIITKSENRNNDFLLKKIG
jgi:hypothetical protein